MTRIKGKGTFKSRHGVAVFLFCSAALKFIARIYSEVGITSLRSVIPVKFCENHSFVGITSLRSVIPLWGGFNRRKAATEWLFLDHK